MSSPPSCPACGRDQSTPLELVCLSRQHADYCPNDVDLQERLTAAAERSAPNYQMQLCGSCGLEFASPMKSPPPSWYELAYEAIELYPGDRWEFNMCLNSFSSGDRVLELGCGDGAFLKRCLDAGIAAVGADFSPAAVRRCAEDGLTAFVLDIENDLPQNVRSSATKVVAFHVLEHLSNPAALFRRALSAAVPDAHLLVSVPSNRRPSRLYQRRDYLDQPPHHMSRWTEDSLRELGMREGWQLLGVTYEPMTFRSDLWSITTHSAVYRVLTSAKFLKYGPIERLFRWLMYPLAAIRRMTVDRKLSGFSMLAQFVAAGANN